MSAYDRTAWDACLKTVYDSRAQRLVPSRVRELTGKAGKAIAAGYEKVPGREHADWIMEKAFDGGMALTFRPALRTVRPESVVQPGVEASPLGGEGERPARAKPRRMR